MRIIKTNYSYCKTIFIPIPKTGSSSIKNLLSRYNIDSLFHPDNHASMNMFIKRYGIEYIRSCHSFTIVRNPYARLVSAYHHFREKGIGQHPTHEPNIDILESTFYKFVSKQLKKSLEDSDSDIMLLNPQSDWAYSRKKKLVKRVFKFEDVFFQKTHKLYQFLKIDNTSKLSHMNQTTHNVWKLYYNSSIQDIVYKIYEKDFDLLQYSKKLIDL